MADPHELFNILRETDDSGLAPDKAIDATTAVAALKGLIGFAFKDSSGNAILPQLTSEGKLPVDTEEVSGSCKLANGELAAGSATLAEVTGAKITGALSKRYKKIEATVSCRHPALFQIVYTDDVGGSPIETIVEECIVGPGQYSFKMGLYCNEIDTTGGTGTQEFMVRAKNFNKQSSLRATLTMLEV